MADGHYRVPEHGQTPAASQPTEIYLNKDFVPKPDQWFPVNSIISQATGANAGMYNNAAPSYPPPGYENAYQYQYAAYGYPGYGYQQPAPPGDAYQQGGWTQTQPGYTTTPQHQQQPGQPQNDTKIEVVKEIQQQKATLTKQREDYVKKAMVLRRELEQLKQQKQELGGDDRSDKELRSVLKGNERLQDEINSKLKAILNVIEMLSSIIKDGKKVADLEAELDAQENQSKQEEGRSLTPLLDPREGGWQMSDSPPLIHLRSERPDKPEKEQRYCYVYYDTGLHWCRACDKFPETAKEFLQHLHSSQHQDRAKENEVDTTPWHKLPVETLLPSFEDAAKKRVPIKGLQFFISAPSWYCKLCDVWIGDLHCASHHLKSQAHFQNYENFVNQNPHWETEWLKDRERAMTRNDKRGGDEVSSNSDAGQKKKKHHRRVSNENILKDKKKKKRSKKKKKESSDSSSSSSSSSDSSSDDDEDEKSKSDRGKSIRVAMRNMQQVKSIMDEDMSKWSVLEKLMEDVRRKEGERRESERSKEPEDELINQWMTVANPVPEKEKNLLESLKDRMKAKQDVEKAKMAELEKRRREKEKEEQEMFEKKRRQAREEAERADRERKRKEQEFNKVLDKDRGHVKFRASRDHFRKRRSSSEDEGRNREERERSYKRESRERSPQFRPRKNNNSEQHIQKVPSPEPPPPPPPPEEPMKRKPPGPPSYKKLPFIGRMPLFKKKMEQKAAERDKEISKEEYEPTRKTRFETGNLTKAYIPKPELVCFPMLSSIPPMMAPPEPTAVEQVAPPIVHAMVAPRPPKAPEPPIIKAPKLLPAPPPPTVLVEQNHHQHNIQPPTILEQNHLHHQQQHNLDNDVQAHGSQHFQTTYYQQMSQQMYQTSRFDVHQFPHPPLEPPPLPPDDDLAMLGICADDMAAQSF